MRRRFTSVREMCAALFLLAVIVALFFWGGVVVRTVVVGYERSALILAPSASHASLYGERHFNAQAPYLYDIGAAEYFYRMALRLDPTYPYVNHQLARIEFLRGNFNTALLFINREIALHGDTEPNTYYVRGLIEGYMGRYADAADDYARFVASDPRNWAALNDYAWVLLKAERFQDAADAAARGLADSPDNPWLLNSSATALFELHRYDEALDAVRRASDALATLTNAEWLRAYPGNDPRTASVGLATFRQAVEDNMHSIERAIATSTVQ